MVPIPEELVIDLAFKKRLVVGDQSIIFLFLLSFTSAKTRSPASFVPLLFLRNSTTDLIELFITSGSSNGAVRGRCG